MWRLWGVLVPRHLSGVCFPTGNRISRDDGPRIKSTSTSTDLGLTEWVPKPQAPALGSPATHLCHRQTWCPATQQVPVLLKPIPYLTSPGVNLTQSGPFKKVRMSLPLSGGLPGLVPSSPGAFRPLDLKAWSPVGEMGHALWVLSYLQLAGPRQVGKAGCLQTSETAC